VYTQEELSLENSLDKSNHEQRAKGAELYEVQQTSELYSIRGLTCRDCFLLLCIHELDFYLTILPFSPLNCGLYTFPDIFAPGSSPSFGVLDTVGLASEGSRLIESGLSTEVVETILQSRAPSTRKLYILKWKLFSTWCGEHHRDPVNCPVGTVLDFLQDCFSAGLSPSTLKVFDGYIGLPHSSGGYFYRERSSDYSFSPWYIEVETCTAL